MDNEQKPPLIGLIGRMNERIKQLHIEGGGSLSGCPCEFDREIQEIQGGGQIDHSRSFPVWLCHKRGELFTDESKFEAHKENCDENREFVIPAFFVIPALKEAAK